MQFYSVEVGAYDNWSYRFVKAACPEEAAVKYMKSGFVSYCEPAVIYEAAFNEHGVLKAGRQLCKVELHGERGYLFDHAQDMIRNICKLCGDWPGDKDNRETFLNKDGKCGACAVLRIIKL